MAVIIKKISKEIKESNKIENTRTSVGKLKNKRKNYGQKKIQYMKNH